MKMQKLKIWDYIFKENGFIFREGSSVWLSTGIYSRWEESTHSGFQCIRRQTWSHKILSLCKKGIKSTKCIDSQEMLRHICTFNTAVGNGKKQGNSLTVFHKTTGKIENFPIPYIIYFLCEYFPFAFWKNTLCNNIKFWFLHYQNEQW